MSERRHMEISIESPVVTRLPGNFADWEVVAGIEDLARVARTADELGYHHLTCSEHVAIPDEIAAVRGGTYWDPLSVFGYLAAVTTRIRFQTHVLVLAYNHPMEIAKRYGTCDRVTGGRLILGMGVGSLQEEFDLIGATFDGRGERGDEAIRALRASLSTEHPEFVGDHYAYSGFILSPCAAQARVPIWIGGRTYRSLRRAVELGDGWVPFGIASDQIREWLARIADTEAWVARSESFDVVLRTPASIDAVRCPERTAEVVAELRGAGATNVMASFVPHSLEDYLEQLEAFAELVDDRS